MSKGYFHIEYRNNRWLLVSPSGDPFFSIGLNHIDSSTLRYPENDRLWEEQFGGDQCEWIRSQVAPDLRRWGFDTIGWVQEVVVRSHDSRRHSRNWIHREYQAASMPYCHMLPFANIHQWDLETRRPDVFSESFAEWCDYVAREACPGMANDPNLIGYFYSDCPNWVHPTASPDLQGPWFDPELLNSESGRQYLQQSVEKYYQVTRDAIRRYDRNHLILGDRMEGTMPLPDLVLQIAARYVDVLSIQYFSYPEVFLKDFEKWHQLTGKPLLLADCRVGLRSIRASESEKGAEYKSIIQKLFETPYVLGWHLCGAYLENKVRKFGLKNSRNEEYTELVTAIRSANLELEEQVQELK